MIDLPSFCHTLRTDTKNTKINTNRLNLLTGLVDIYPNHPHEFNITNFTWDSVATIDTLNNEVKITVTRQMQELISNNKSNDYAIVLRNNNRNIDFAHIRFYGLDAADIEKRPRLYLRYATLK